MLGDLHVLDLATLTWGALPPAAQQQPRLCRHGLAVSGTVAVPGAAAAPCPESAAAGGEPAAGMDDAGAA